MWKTIVMVSIALGLYLLNNTVNGVSFTILLLTFVFIFEFATVSCSNSFPTQPQNNRMWK